MAVLSRLWVVAVMTAWLTACGAGEPEPSQQPPVRPVKLITIDGPELGQSRSFPAVVRAASSSELTFQVSGLLQELPVAEGQEVEQGAILASLDPRDFRSQLESATAEYENADTEYQRALRLAAGNAIATSQVEQRQARRETAKAQLDRADKSLADSVLRAPFAGVVAKVHVRRFQNVQAQEQILTLIGTESLEAVVNVPSKLIITSQANQDVEAFVAFAAAPAVRIPAAFKEVVLEADTASQTYEASFQFAWPEDLVILPGMNATLTIDTEDIAAEGQGISKVAVPLSAVLSEGGRSFVWVIDTESMTARRRWVTIQPGVGETALVIEGLEPGETIAGAGTNYLAEGMRVRPWTD